MKDKKNFMLSILPKIIISVVMVALFVSFVGGMLGFTWAGVVAAISLLVLVAILIILVLYFIWTT